MAQPPPHTPGTLSDSVGPEDSARLAAIIESSDDAILSKSLDGIITTWNAGAQRIFGYTAEEMIGQSVMKLIPADRENEEPDIVARIGRGERVEHYETVRRRKDGSLIDISLTVSPLKNAQGVIVGASKIARDITERKNFERLMRKQSLHLETVNRISKLISADLELERIVQAVIDIATELTGARFGAFFYKAPNKNGERYMLYTLSGAPREAFEKFGMPRATAVFQPTFRGDGTVLSDDIRTDPRYGKNAPHKGMPEGHLPVVSYLAVPVKSRTGEVIGGIFFGHDQPGVFTAEAVELVESIVPHAAIAVDNARMYRTMREEVESRRRAEEAQEFLLSEIRHRVKNTLATVQAIAGQTLRSVPLQERKVFGARLQALAGAHDLLTRQNWDRADIHHIVDRTVMPFRERTRERFDISGPEVGLNAARSLLLAMILHELATNAVKYGALSNDQGRVVVAWEICDMSEENSAPRRYVRLVWREVDGPEVTAPEKKGFGSTLIERALEGNHGNSNISYAADGVVCTLDIII